MTDSGTTLLATPEQMRPRMGNAASSRGDGQRITPWMQCVPASPALLRILPFQLVEISGWTSDFVLWKTTRQPHSTNTKFPI